MTSLMKNNLEHRISKIGFESTNYLMPIFEAITNSIQAIDDYQENSEEKKEDGLIKVFFNKKDDTQLNLSFTEEELKGLPIRNIEISDNGCGFNPINFDSFITYDSMHKKTKGGKGTGRLSWLKLFNKVLIESHYQQESKYLTKTFEFSIEDNGVDSDKLVEKEIDYSHFERGTRIKLIGLKKGYQKYYNHELLTYGKEIISHFLSFFANDDKCPRIVISDNHDTEILNELFKENLLSETAISKETFDINEERFNLTFLKLKGIKHNSHKLCFCADGREVKAKTINLSSSIANLKTKILDEETNENFFFNIFVSSKYLNDNIDESRTNFTLKDDEKNKQISHVLDFNTIKIETINHIKKHIEEYLKKIEEKKIKEIEDYVRNENQQFRILLSEKHRNRLEVIPPNLTPKKLDRMLYDIYHDIDMDTKEKTSELLSEDIKTQEDYEKYTEKYSKYVDDINEMGKSKLANYIAHRKAMIDLLAYLQKLTKDNRYALEKAIHENIFPMNADSDEIDYNKHNLWIIDEKLSYHTYLASDKKFKSMDAIESDANTEPDLIIFNRPFLLSENEEKMSAVSIIEFKRPERANFPDDDDPLKQIINYVRDLKASKAKDKYGSSITLGSNTPIYAYIMCTLTPKVIEIAEDCGYLTKAPDNMGYFGFHPTHGIYFEIISYKKVVQDAKDRNRILFEKLNI